MSEEPSVDFLDNFARFERTDRSLASIQMSFKFVNCVFYFPTLMIFALLVIQLETGPDQTN